MQEHLTAAAYPLKLGTNTYRAEPLNDQDISELDNYVRKCYLDTAKLAINSDTSKEDRQEIMDVAIRTAATLSAFTGTGARIIATIDGWARMVWQMIHRNHPTVTYEQLRKEMLNPANIQEANGVFRKTNMPETVVKKPAKNAGKRGARTEAKQTKAQRRKHFLQK